MQGLQSENPGRQLVGKHNKTQAESSGYVLAPNTDEPGDDDGIDDTPIPLDRENNQFAIHQRYKNNNNPEMQVMIDAIHDKHARTTCQPAKSDGHKATSQSPPLHHLVHLHDPVCLLTIDIGFMRKI